MYKHVNIYVYIFLYHICIAVKSELCAGCPSDVRTRICYAHTYAFTYTRAYGIHASAVFASLSFRRACARGCLLISGYGVKRERRRQSLAMLCFACSTVTRRTAARKTNTRFAVRVPLHANLIRSLRTTVTTGLFVFVCLFGGFFFF